MQPGDEVVDDSKQAPFDLETHFKRNGMSENAFVKIAADVSSGDINVDILGKLDQNELIVMANEYKLTPIQAKAFIEGVKLLPNAKIDKDRQNEKSFVYVTPEEQSVFETLNQLLANLNKCDEQYTHIVSKNKNLIKSNIVKIDRYVRIIKQSVDDAANTIEKSLDILRQKLDMEKTEVNTLEMVLNCYLNCKNDETGEMNKHANGEQTANNFENIRQNVEIASDNVNDILFCQRKRLNEIVIKDKLGKNVNKFINTLASTFNDSFTIEHKHHNIAIDNYPRKIQLMLQQQLPKQNDISQWLGANYSSYNKTDDSV